MDYLDIIRAWKDPEFRRRLSEHQRGQVPAHPAGAVELTDADLGLAAGGAARLPDTVQTSCLVAESGMANIC